MSDLLAISLTEAQRAAIEHAGGPVLIVAGPGAGKTDVMVRRMAYLVLERGVAPENLLVTTFTNKAADELYDRLYPYLRERAHAVRTVNCTGFPRCANECTQGQLVRQWAICTPAPPALSLVPALLVPGLVVTGSACPKC